MGTEPPRPRSPPLRQSASGTREPRILVFDDDEGSAYAVAAMLRSAGYHVDIATHFSPALQVIEGSTPPDLLVADIVVPPGQVHGFALARMAHMKRPDLKVIFLTGYETPTIEQGALGPILRKPVSEELLLATVQQVLGS